MFFKKKEYEVAYVEGRKAILLSMYEVITSILKDLFPHYQKDDIGEAAAIVINLITHRNEQRPDPRELQTRLGKELKDITSRQLIKEAAAFVLILDHYIEDFKIQFEDINRFEEAIRIAGPITQKIIDKLNPSNSKPKEIYKLSLLMSEKLSTIANSQINLN